MTPKAYLPAVFMLVLSIPLGLEAQTPGPAKPAAPADARQAEIAQLVGVLRSEADDYQKIKACKRLALVGDGGVIAVVSPLLVNERLSHGARLVLEAIADAEATAALRNAMPTVKGKTLVGVINSLGALGDEKATAALGQKLADADPEVVCAAAAALGRIGTPEASQLLLAAAPKSTAPTRSALGDACLACAEAVLGRGKGPQATAIFDGLLGMDMPELIKLAALRGAILTGQNGLDRLLAELQSKEEHRFVLALGVARECPAEKVAPAVAGLLATASAEHQVSLLGLLQGLGDASARPAVLSLLKNSPTQVRAAAVRSLSTLGDATTLPVLFEAAGQPDALVAGAARDALATMTHPEVDAAVVAMAEKAEGKSRLLLFDVVGRRRILAAVPLLTKAADDPDAEVRRVALRALGQAVDANHLPLLVARLAAATNPPEMAAAHEALRIACSRLPDKQACAEKLTAGLKEASPQVKCILLDVLNIAGESTALAAVAAGINDANPDVRDTATRVLGNWPTPEAAPALLEAATRAADGKLRIRSLRGYVRIARQLDIGDGHRLQICRKAMEVAERDEERRLVLDACTRVAAPASLAFVVSHLDNPGLKDAACAAAVSIAERLVSAEPKACAEAAERVLPLTKDGELTRRAQEVLAKAKGNAAGKK
jgi:HEAT repeat protein